MYVYFDLCSGLTCAPGLNKLLTNKSKEKEMDYIYDVIIYFSSAKVQQ